MTIKSDSKTLEELIIKLEIASTLSDASVSQYMKRRV